MSNLPIFPLVDIAVHTGNLYGQNLKVTLSENGEELTGVLSVRLMEQRPQNLCAIKFQKANGSETEAVFTVNSVKNVDLAAPPDQPHQG